MNKQVVTIILLSILAALLALLAYLIIVKHVITSTSSSTTTSSTTTSTSSSFSTFSSTTCNITCPPGYEVNPLTCECSPLVPANIIVQPNPTLNIPLWAAFSITSQSQQLCGADAMNYSACLGVLPSDLVEGNCCPSSAPTCACIYCDKRYGCNPKLGQTSGTTSFYATVISSNGTPIPNTKVNISSALPGSTSVSLPAVIGNFATIELTVNAPPSSVTSDSNGRIIIPVNFNAKITYYNAALLAVGIPVGGNYCAAIGTKNLQFYLSIPNTAIYVPANVQLNASLCINIVTNYGPMNE